MTDLSAASSGSNSNPNNCNPSNSNPVDTAIWIQVCNVTDIPFDAGVAALLNENTAQETQIALFRPLDSDTVYAIGNFDPFSAANVLGRGILCSVGAELAVASPILKQHFSLTTGQCLEDTTVTIPTYPVAVRDGVVFVQSPLAHEGSL